MRKIVCAFLTLTLALALSACGGGEGEGSQASPSSSSAAPEPELRVEMQVQEYPEDDYVRAVEIPILTGEVPGLETANTPFLHLREEQERLAAQGRPVLEVHAYPFAREDWIQVLTTELHYESDAGLSVESANYDRKAGAFVTVTQALERLSLTAEGLEETLAAQNLQPEEYETELLHLWQPQAFFVREDGSMVFFLLAEYGIVGNQDAMGPRALVCYDSGTDAFSLAAPGDLLLAEGPDVMDPPLAYGRTE